MLLPNGGLVKTTLNCPSPIAARAAECHSDEHKECKIEEGHLMPDHVHMLISIPPKYAVAQIIGYIKGKSAIHIARTYMGVRRNFVGQNFWARGYFVSTVGRDEAAVRDYIRKQEAEDKRLEQMKLKM
ncbi:MAG: IS200/IS605 family transposase [Patescibacteria group bacterium]|nr:IS200/IS605 family transposase [Patescibacteria group bacterium]